MTLVDIDKLSWTKWRNATRKLIKDEEIVSLRGYYEWLKENLPYLIKGSK